MGYCTPTVAALALAFHNAIWLGLGIDNAGTVVVFALDATALALLGPSAYSVDSYRFGRRFVRAPSAMNRTIVSVAHLPLVA